MNVAQQVALALGGQRQAGPAAAFPTEPDESGQRTDPARVIYALGWIVANAIVRARYRDSAIDALPVYHPEHGWDRFLLTRRVSCALLGDEPADAFGMLMLSGDDAPRLTQPNGETRLALGALLRSAPRRAIAAALDLLPPVGLVEGDHAQCWHERATSYPTLYGVVTEVIVERPEVTVAREVFIDDQQIEGMFHPLHLHTGGRAARMAYDWFEIESRDYVAYVRIHGEQAVYATATGRWATVARPLVAERRAGMKQRILAWLRLAGQPDPTTVD